MQPAQKFKVWLRAFRLHTLPLSFSGLLLGNLVAFTQHSIDTFILVMGILTGICLQVLSNLANDYGDFIHGTDSEKRIGPERTVQSGAVSPQTMKKAIIILILLSMVSGLLLLYAGMKNIGFIAVLILLILGLAAIWSAYHYTASKKPYGYKGWGDLFVFIFFGLVAVTGSYYLQTGNMKAVVFLPAAAMGFFSAAVLNLNNIRDISNDRDSGKITIAVRLGLKGARIYHFVLLLAGIILQCIYCSIIYNSFYQFIFLLPLILIIINGIMVFIEKYPGNFYLYLKQLSISILIYVICFWISLIV